MYLKSIDKTWAIKGTICMQLCGISECRLADYRLRPKTQIPGEHLWIYWCLSLYPHYLKYIAVQSHLHHLQMACGTLCMTSSLHSSLHMHWQKYIAVQGHLHYLQMIFTSFCKSRNFTQRSSFTLKNGREVQRLVLFHGFLLYAIDHADFDIWDWICILPLCAVVLRHVTRIAWRDWSNSAD